MVDPQNMTDPQNPPERPRSEPEIIPPGRNSGQGGNAGNPPWQATWQTGWGQNGRDDGSWRTQRVFVMRPGPLGFAVLMLALGLIVAAIVVTLIGAFLIWIPVVALFVAGAAVFRFLRR
jgi:hypothetical protein